MVGRPPPRVLHIECHCSACESHKIWPPSSTSQKPSRLRNGQRNDSTGKILGTIAVPAIRRSYRAIGLLAVTLPTVDVDLSAVLKAGQKYRVLSVKDSFGPAIVSGVFESKPVKIPMKPVKAVQPVGMPEAELPVTEPKFAAFVVLAD